MINGQYCLGPSWPINPVFQVFIPRFLLSSQHPVCSLKIWPKYVIFLVLYLIKLALVLTCWFPCFNHLILNPFIGFTSLELSQITVSWYCLRSIDHRRRLLGGSPGTCPPNNWETPMHFSLLTTLCPPIFWFAHPIFLTSLRQCHWYSLHKFQSCTFFFFPICH